MITNDGFLECIILYNAQCTMHAGETIHCEPCYNWLPKIIIHAYRGNLGQAHGSFSSHYLDTLTYNHFGPSQHNLLRFESHYYPKVVLEIVFHNSVCQMSVICVRGQYDVRNYSARKSIKPEFSRLLCHALVNYNLSLPLESSIS